MNNGEIKVKGYSGSARSMRQMSDLELSRTVGGMPVFTDPLIPEGTVLAFDMSKLPIQNPPSFAPKRLTADDIWRLFGVDGNPFQPKPKEKTIMSLIENLKNKIAADKAKLAIIESLGEDDFEDGAILVFTKTFEQRVWNNEPPKEYHYAAIKSPKGWYLTGRESRAFTWPDLVEFMSEGVQSVEMVTELGKIA